MKKLKNNENIEVLEVSFDGVKDMVTHARKRMPKDGVYVGEDSEHYPCFDSSDYAYESRYYTNLVFARSKEELDKKMSVLELMKSLKANYNKLTAELHPMAYWEGDTNHDVFLTEDTDE